MTTDPAALDLLLTGAKLLPGDALVRLFEHSPGLRPLLDRLERISGQLLKSSLKRIDLPEGADARTVRRAWLSCLLRIDALANLDHARVATLARGGSWQWTVDCPCGCGTNMKPVFHLDYHPSRN
jgi:hypothetical protein